MELAQPLDPTTLLISLGAQLLHDLFGIPIGPWWFDPQRWNDPNFWIGQNPLPDNYKTLVTGARLAGQSTIPLVVALGLRIANLAKQGRILSRPSDIAQYFGPAIELTTATLRPDLPQGTLTLQPVIFAGQPVSGFDRRYYNLRSFKPDAVLSENDFLKLRPGHKYDREFARRVNLIWPRLYPPAQPPAPPPKQPCGCTPPQRRTP